MEQQHRQSSDGTRQPDQTQPAQPAAAAAQSKDWRDAAGHQQSSSPAATSTAGDDSVLSPKSTAGDGDAQVYIPAAERAPPSIYGLYSTRRRNTILLAAAFTSILVPFCDTVYLPALAVSSSRRFSCDACCFVAVAVFSASPRPGWRGAAALPHPDTPATVVVVTPHHHHQAAAASLTPLAQKATRLTNCAACVFQCRNNTGDSERPQHKC